MRRVAAEFDTGPASLYAYVANKRDLLRLVLDRIVDEVPVPSGVVRGRTTVRNYALQHPRGDGAAQRRRQALLRARCPPGNAMLRRRRHAS